MTASILFLILGLVLLFTPRTWLRLGRGEFSRSRRVSQANGQNRERQPGENALWPSEEFVRRRNWLDTGRAMAGGYAILAAMPPLVNYIVAVPDGKYATLTLGMIAGVMFAGLLIQTLRVETRLTLFPPVFYIMGLLFPLIGWKAAILSIITIWVINIVLPNAGVFLVALGGLAMIFGVMFGSGEKYAVVAGAISAFPAILAVVFRRRLAQYRKKTKIVAR